MTRRRSPVLRVFSAAATALLLLAILGPFFQVLQGALFPQGTGFSLEAVYKVFLATPEYLLVFWRTIALCGVMVAGQVILSVLAGLGFAKYDFPGKGLWFFLLLVVMVLPLQVTLVPNFRILGTLNLLDTQWALVLPALFAPLGTFLMTQSFRAVPDEILELLSWTGLQPSPFFGGSWCLRQKRLGLCHCSHLFGGLEHGGAAHGLLKRARPVPLVCVPGHHWGPGSGGAAGLLPAGLAAALAAVFGAPQGAGAGHRPPGGLGGGIPPPGISRALAITLAILVECTILSGMISREMAIQVTVASPRHDQEGPRDSLPLDAFRQEEDGTFRYLLEEGTGLLGSTQLRRVSTDILSLEGERAFTTGLEQRGSYVVYASRPLEDEEWAVETVPSDPAPDTYLLWVPEGIELDAPSASAEGGTLYLLPQEEAPQPS